MHILRQSILFIALISVTVAANCQQHLAKSLLWRITGNGLNKPSYLFGTMHLNDKRLFKFDDSVYKALENTEGMAIEVNPDEMAAYFANKLFDDVSNEKRLKEVLGNKDFNKYSRALAKKFNKSAEKVTVGDVVKEKHKWMSDYMAKGEMPTFVDAYLYNIARRQGKWVGGIEDIADQAGLIDEMVDKSDLDYLLASDSDRNSEATISIDKMISLYTDQDIEAIESFSGSSTSPGKMDLLLIKRNIKMARRIDSLTALRSMFLAIGSAHLAGDSGVISLLQKRGFTLEPVFCTKKTYAKDYTFKEVHIPWVEVEDPSNAYKILMPGNPASIKLYGVIDMRFLLDIFNMSGFCSMAFMSPSNFTNKDSLYEMFVGKMFKDEKNYTEKTVKNNDIEGKEFISPKLGESIRLQIYISGKMVYMLFFTGLKKELLSSEDANKFFSSFKIGTPPAVVTKSVEFTDSVMGVSLSTPSKLSYNKAFSNEEGEGWKVKGYAGIDIATGTYTILFSKEVRPGFHIQSDSTVFSDFFKTMKMKCENLKNEMIEFHGHRAQKLTGNTSDQPSVILTCINIVTNNRNIVLMVVTDSSNLHSPQVENIYNSFKFIDHKVLPWQTYSSPDSLFSAWAPGKFWVYETHSQEKEVIAYDTTTSTTYNVIIDTLGKYIWYKDDSSFWKSSQKRYTLGKILLNTQPISNGPLKGQEYFLKASKDGDTYGRMRVIVNGNLVYKLFVSGEKSYIYSDNMNKFFTSFKITNPLSNQGFITEPKSSVILDALSSNDSSTRESAYNVFKDAPFKESDSTMLYNYLFRKYRSPYSSRYFPGVNEDIGSKLIDLKIPSLVTYLSNKYNTFTKDDSDFKDIVLILLAKDKTHESYNQFAYLLTSSNHDTEIPYECQMRLQDSLALLTSIYPRLLKLAGDSAQGRAIAALGLELLDSNFISLSKLSEYQNDLIHNGLWIFQHAKPGVEPSLGWNDYKLVELLGRFNTEQSNKMLKDLLAIKDDEFIKDIIIELARNNQVIPATSMNKVAGNLKWRAELYKQLKKMNKISLFPKQFSSQAALSESMMFESANQDEDDPTKIQFLSKKIASYKGKKYLFYLYKVTYNSGDNATSYLGVTGAFDTNSNSTDVAKDLSGIYIHDIYRSDKLDTYFKNWMKNLEEDQDE